jgi:aspartyl-tRNA(Asn)/glutamyl-tRNA(Gln) amidotransferase subunit A
MPASVCGVVGMKATYGRVSKAGVFPLSYLFDHAGPLTRTVEDAALVLNALAGYDARDPACQAQPVPDYTRALQRGIDGLRIGVIENHFMERNADDVQACIEARLDELARDGATLLRCRMPILDYGLAAIYAIELASSGAYHDRSIAAGRSAGFEPDVRDLVELGRLVTAVDYLKAEQVRTLMCEQFEALFDKVDVVVTPTEPLTAWPRGQSTVSIRGQEESVLGASWRLTYPFNLTGLPAISVPCGFDRNGMPIGLQIAGRPFDETTVLRCAHGVERIVGTLPRPRLEAAPTRAGPHEAPLTPSTS